MVNKEWNNMSLYHIQRMESKTPSRNWNPFLKKNF